MKNKIFSLILVLIVPLLVFCGCGTTSADYKEINEQRFIFVSKYAGIEEPNSKNVVDIYILADKETKIMYIYLTGYNRCGITPLLDKEGNVTYYKGNLS